MNGAQRDAIQRKAAVVKVLRDQLDGSIGDWAGLAGDILDALDSWADAEVPSPPASDWCDACDMYMNAEQEIRAKALDSAARLLGPGLADILGAAPYEVVMQTAIEEWERATRAAAFYIECGSFHGPLGLRAEAALKPDGGGAAERATTPAT